MGLLLLRKGSQRVFSTEAYGLWPMALVENTLLNLHNSSQDTQPHSTIVNQIFIHGPTELALRQGHARSMHFVRNEFRNSLLQFI